LRVHIFWTELSRFFEIDFSLIWQIGAHLQHGQAQVGIGTGGIGSNSFLHFLQRRAQVVLRSVEVGPRQVSVRTVRLFLAQEVEM